MIAVQWLDKRGTAIVCLTLAKEGRLLVKTSMDLNGWFDDLQVGFLFHFFLLFCPSVSVNNDLSRCSVASKKPSDDARHC